MARSVAILAALASGLILALVPMPAAAEPDLEVICAESVLSELDRWTGFWSVNTVGRTVFVLSGSRFHGVYAGGVFSGERVAGIRAVGTFTGRKPMRPQTSSSGRFDIRLVNAYAQKFSGTWYAKDLEGEEEKGVLRGTFLSGFWQGGWRTNLGHVVFAHPSPAKDKLLVRGRYPWSGGGTIWACVEGANGRALSGFYEDKTGRGEFTIYLNRDLNRFAGRYTTPDGKRTGRWFGEFVSGRVKR